MPGDEVMMLKLCTYPGCNCLVSNGTRCPKHQRTERANGFSGKRKQSASEWHSLYYSARWKRLRKEFLKSHPYCFLCGANATIADHIHPHRGNLELFYDENNLQAMCWSCHSKKTLRENNFFHGGEGESKTSGL